MTHTGKPCARPILAAIAISLLLLPVLQARAGDKPFPHTVPALYGSLPEGFAIGRGATAYNGSIDGSIYRADLRSGEGATLVEPEPGFDVATDCFKLGMRVDPRTNYLFVAGCQGGNAYVFDADNGALLMKYQLPLPPAYPPGSFQIVNDLAITRDAVYFTDSHQPLLYRLPLSADGGLPGAGAATAIELGGDFVNIPPEDGCCGANGIVATPDGKTLVIGHSNFSQLFRLTAGSGDAREIQVDAGVGGFFDGLVLRGHTLYILVPDPQDMVQVVNLAPDMLSGTFAGVITDPDMDGVASGAFFGNSLYVNNARYAAPLVSEKWITRLDPRTAE